MEVVLKNYMKKQKNKPWNLKTQINQPTTLYAQDFVKKYAK